MDGMKVALGNRGMTVEAAQQYKIIFAQKLSLRDCGGCAKIMTEEPCGAYICITD